MSEDLVGMLREKTEEADLDTILKTNMGGYTRKSVQEYLGMIRRQQTDLKQAFSDEIERTMSEKDRLQQELADALDRTAAAERALESAQPMVEKAAALEKDMDEAVSRIQQDMLLLSQAQQQLSESRQQLDESRQQLAENQQQLAENRQQLESQKEQAKSLEAQLEELRSKLVQAEEEKAVAKSELAHKQAQLNQAEREKAEALRRASEYRAAQQAAAAVPIPAAAPAPAAGGQTELPADPGSFEITDLFNRPEVLQNQLGILDKQLRSTTKWLESVMQQEQSLYKALDDCRSELKDRQEQMEWKEFENKELSRRLAVEIQQNVSMGRELARLKAMTETLKKKQEPLRELSGIPGAPKDAPEMGDISYEVLRFQ